VGKAVERAALRQTPASREGPTIADDAIYFLPFRGPIGQKAACAAVFHPAAQPRKSKVFEVRQNRLSAVTAATTSALGMFLGWASPKLQRELISWLRLLIDLRPIAIQSDLLPKCGYFGIGRL